jgi:pimeloyl-ACP methyl ester carboxylesterase
MDLRGKELKYPRADARGSVAMPVQKIVPKDKRFQRSTTNKIQANEKQVSGGIMLKIGRAGLGVFCGILWACMGFAQSQLDGRWQGAIEIQGISLTIEVTFTTAPQGLAAAIDIPQQGAKALALRNVSFVPPKVHFELPAGPGLAVFEGTLKDDTINGTFQQGPAAGTFAIRRGPAAPAPPAEPLPYETDEVVIKNGDVTLGGTLSLPANGAPSPALVFITGSGAQDRDEDVLGFKVFKILADHLTRNGFAVLRLDDRGVGKSTGNLAKSTSEDFAGDALAAVAYLKTHKGIDPARIGLLGHSEGGLVAPLAATRSRDVAFIVLMSGPSLTGERIMLEQNYLVLRAEGAPEADIKENGEIQRMLFAAVKTDQGWDEVDAAIRRSLLARIARMTAEERKGIPDAEAVAAQRAAAQIAGYKTLWFKYFLTYDPAPVLAKVICPVLALFGEKDVQVPAEMNRKEMVAAFERGGNKAAVTKIIAGANHLYQAAKTGGVGEYASLPKAFAPEFLDTLIVWLKATTSKK